MEENVIRANFRSGMRKAALTVEECLENFQVGGRAPPWNYNLSEDLIVASAQGGFTKEAALRQCELESDEICAQNNKEIVMLGFGMLTEAKGKKIHWFPAGRLYIARGRYFNMPKYRYIVEEGQPKFLVFFPWKKKHFDLFQDQCFCTLLASHLCVGQYAEAGLTLYDFSQPAGADERYLRVRTKNRLPIVSEELISRRMATWITAYDIHQERRSPPSPAPRKRDNRQDDLFPNQDG